MTDLQVTADTIAILESIANDHAAKHADRISATKELRRIQEALNPPEPAERVGATIYILWDGESAETLPPGMPLPPGYPHSEVPEPSHSGVALEKERTARIKDAR